MRPDKVTQPVRFQNLKAQF